MPEATLKAVADHGVARRHGADGLRRRRRDDAGRSAAAGIDFDDVVPGRSRTRASQKFDDSWDELHRRRVRKQLEGQGVTLLGVDAATGRRRSPGRRARPRCASRRRRRPAAAARTPRCGARGEAEARSGSAGWTCRELPRAGRASSRAARRAARRGRRPRRAVRHGRLVARARGHLPDAGVPLVVLDTTDPGQVRAALTDLERTVVVVARKSGGTVETDSHRRASRARSATPGWTDQAGARSSSSPTPARRFGDRRGEGARAVFLADPDVGGRYSALTAFGLVPSALAGADVGALLDEAAALRRALVGAPTTPRSCSAPRSAAPRGGRDKLVLADGDAASPASATGPSSWSPSPPASRATGMLPVVVERPDAPGTEAAGRGAAVRRRRRRPTRRARRTAVTGPLGAQFLAWEYATAVAGWVLGINPFDQPNVRRARRTPARSSTAACPTSARPPSRAASRSAPPAACSTGSTSRPTTASGWRSTRCVGRPARGYLAVMAYLDRRGRRGRRAARPRWPRRPARR